MVVTTLTSRTGASVPTADVSSHATGSIASRGVERLPPPPKEYPTSFASSSPITMCHVVEGDGREEADLKKHLFLYVCLYFFFFIQ